MKWKHDFYQCDPECEDRWKFYHSQRSASAIFEKVREIKGGYYEVKCVEIVSDEEFRVMGQAGGCEHQYRIGDIFRLRIHRDKGYSWVCDYSERFWYDPRFRDHSYTERFLLIEE